MKLDTQYGEIESVSMMPEGVLDFLSNQQVIDLVRYLQSDHEVSLKWYWKQQIPEFLILASRKFLFFYIVLRFSSDAKAQNSSLFKLVFDHQTLIVSDLLETGDFYRDVLLFDEIPLAAGMNPPKRWFKNSEGKEIHLIARKRKNLIQYEPIHLAFTVGSMESFIKHLEIRKIKYGSWFGEKGKIGTRDYEVRQMYL